MRLSHCQPVFVQITVLFFSYLLIGCQETAVEGKSAAKPKHQAEQETTTTVVNSTTAIGYWTAEIAHEALREKNLDYNGQGVFRIEDGKVIAAQLSGTGITDLSPLSQMTSLSGLDLRGLMISNLGPLQGLPLTHLYLEETLVEDLHPLRGIKLQELYLSRTTVKDLSPLRGMPLQKLNLLGTSVTDLSPLESLTLQFLWLNETLVEDISPISQCPLLSLTLHKTRVRDLSPLTTNNRLQRLHIGDTPVTDLTPITKLALTRLILRPGNITRGLTEAKAMATIREIGTTFENRMAPAMFWNLYDRGQLK